ncbi:UNVERIFIED_ORG: invasion protein IalB [Martelella mediterranea]
MKRVAKSMLGAGIAGLGVFAVIAMTSGQGADGGADTLVAPARAETVEVAQAEKPAEAGSAPVTLANGATTVQESYADWQVTCGIREQTKICTMVQQQTNAETRQRVLAIELTVNGDGLEGALVLPFGILLDSGVALQVDDGERGEALRFRTCLPTGCVVPLEFDSGFTAALVKGGTLKVHTVQNDRQEIAFRISLRGFNAARNRIAELLG